MTPEPKELSTKPRTCTEILDSQGYVPPLLGGIGQEIRREPKATDLSPVKPKRAQTPGKVARNTDGN